MPNNTHHTVIPRAILCAYDCVCALVVASLLSLGIAKPAYAYVDPSVMTYAIQAVAGVAVALSAIAGVAFRRSRKWICDKLGIDTEAKRERDPHWEFIDSSIENARLLPVESLNSDTARMEAVRTNEQKAERVGQLSSKGVRYLSWPKRFGLALIVSFMTAGTLMLAAPLEVVSASSDFLFTPRETASALMMPTVAVSVVAALILSLVRGRAFAYGLALYFSVGLGFYLQGMFMNVGLPIADGNTVDWSKHDKIALITALAWAAIFAIPALFVRFRQQAATIVVAILSCALVIVQGVGVGSILVSNGASKLYDGSLATQCAAVTEEGLFDVAPDNNVIVFVLDTYDVEYLQQALSQEPTLLDSFTGFTWYENASGAMVPTRYGLPYLLTGEWPHEDEGWQSYLKNRYDRSSFLDDISQLGYSSGIYSANLSLGKTTQQIADEKIISNTFNIRNTRVSGLSQKGTIKSMMIIALYRDLPWVLKPRFWFDTDTVVMAMVDKSASKDPSQTEYVRDDFAFYEKLKEQGLSVVDRGDAGEFRLIHLNGPHSPWRMNANGERVEKSTRINQAIGSMRIVEYYLDEMRELGVYDDATIIITADHGAWYLTDTPIDKPAAPIVIAKPAQSAAEAARPLEVSDAPVTQGDVLPTIISSIGGDPSLYAGKSLFDYNGSEDPQTERLYLCTLSNSRRDTSIVEFSIRGDVSDFSNWSLTGRSWNARS